MKYIYEEWQKGKCIAIRRVIAYSRYEAVSKLSNQYDGLFRFITVVIE